MNGRWISPTIHLVQILEEKIRWDGKEAMRFFRFQKILIPHSENMSVIHQLRCLPEMRFRDGSWCWHLRNIDVCYHKIQQRAVCQEIPWILYDICHFFPHFISQSNHVWGRMSRWRHAILLCVQGKRSNIYEGCIFDHRRVFVLPLSRGSGLLNIS